MAWNRCITAEKKPKNELLLIHQNGGPGSYDTRWFYFDKNGVLSLVHSSINGGGYTYTYVLADGSTLKISMLFDNGCWHPKFTSSKDRDIKINLDFDGSGPTTYHLTANTETEEILIPLLTVWTGYLGNPRYNGGPGLIIEVVSDDTISPIDSLDGNVRYLGSYNAISVLDVTNFKSIYLKSSVTLSNPGYYFVSIDGTQVYGPGTLSLDTTIDITNNTSVELGVRGTNGSSDATLNYVLS